MRKILLILSLIFLCTSCFVHKGHRVDGQCRPKKPNFKLNKSFFNDSDELVLNKIYIVDVHPKSFGYGFYSDGRLVFLHSKDGFELKSEDVFGIRWENAPAIGYWRFNGNKIETEYFSCSNSGDYIRKQGEIKGDTIIFERDCGTSNPFKTIKCPEKYILSDMRFEQNKAHDLNKYYRDQAINEFKNNTIDYLDIKTMLQIMYKQYEFIE